MIVDASGQPRDMDVESDAILVLDRGGNVVSWSALAGALDEIEPDDVVGQHMSSFYTPQDVAAGRPRDLLRRAARDGWAHAEGWRVRGDGTHFWADELVASIRNVGGEVTGYFEVMRDLTRRRRAEQQLQLLVASVEDYAIFMLDPRGCIVTWNEGAQHIKGYTADEAIGQSFEMFYTPEDRAQGKPARMLARATEHGRIEDEGWRVRKDGERFWANAILTRIVDARGDLVGFAKVTRDLTARKAAEDALRTSEESLSATLYSIGDGVIATDEQGCVTRVNPAAERLTGWTQAEASGHPIEEVFPIINERTRVPAPDPVRRVLATGVVVGLANHTALIARDGTERPVADSGAPIRDATGALRGVVLVFRDVSEERRLEEEFQRARRAEQAMREREVFLSIAAHELRTPLAALTLKLQGIEQLAAPDADTVQARIGDAVRQTAHLSGLVERLLDVSRIAAGRLVIDPEACDLGAVVDAAVARTRDVDVHVARSGDLRGAWDLRRLEQVIGGLLSNAGGNGKSQRVELSLTADDRFVHLVVGGVALAHDDLSRIFAPFEHAAAVDHFMSNDLGLYIAKGIVEAHGGSISICDHGATFEVRLPRNAP